MFLLLLLLDVCAWSCILLHLSQKVFRTDGFFFKRRKAPTMDPSSERMCLLFVRKVVPAIMQHVSSMSCVGKIRYQHDDADRQVCAYRLRH